jgi:hypothetical protein
MVNAPIIQQELDSELNKIPVPENASLNCYKLVHILILYVLAGAVTKEPAS